MKVLLYICGVVAAGIGIYEIFFWLTKSSMAIVIILLAFILAIISFALASVLKKIGIRIN